MMKLLGKLFGKRPDTQTLDIPTKPVPLERRHGVQDDQQVPRQLIVGCAQSVGKQREHNEDALFTLTTTLTSDYSNVPFGLFIVADGMGCHQYGELASGIAIRTMASYIVEKLYAPLLSIKPTSPEDSMQEIMQNGIQEAHRTILRNAPGGGTTMTAVLILGDQLTVAHVGDSRAYLLGNNGKFDTLTRDHSLVKRLVELGQISIDEAASHPQRNVLYRALGQGESFDADIKTTQLPDVGQLLVCSDGLWGVVPEDQVRSIIANNTSPEIACNKLVEAANAAGGPDNITCILIRFPN